MIANLMMYARPETDGALNRYWQAICKGLTGRGIDSPVGLAQGAEEFTVWRDPSLVLSQTCGMPYRLWLHEDVQLVGTPDFGLDGCPPGYYRSALIVRESDRRADLSDFADARFAYNQTYSQSGWAAAYTHLKLLGVWFQDQLHTGSHNVSARSVAENRADIAALDGQTWRLLQRYEPWAKRLRVLDWTDPTPGLPYITGANLDAELVTEAVADAIDGLDPGDRDALDLKGLVHIPKADYLAIANPPATAEVRKTV